MGNPALESLIADIVQARTIRNRLKEEADLKVAMLRELLVNANLLTVHKDGKKRYETEKYYITYIPEGSKRVYKKPFDRALFDALKSVEGRKGAVSEQILSASEFHLPAVFDLLKMGKITQEQFEAVFQIPPSSVRRVRITGVGNDGIAFTSVEEEEAEV
jgi:hypothetical protein